MIDYTILPFFLISHIRCHYCGDRYATFGFGKSRIVFRRSTSRTATRAALVLLCAVIVGGAVALLVLR